MDVPRRAADEGLIAPHVSGIRLGRICRMMAENMVQTVFGKTPRGVESSLVSRPLTMPGVLSSIASIFVGLPQSGDCQRSLNRLRRH